MDAAQWSFILTDAAGNNLAELSTALGRSITFKRNTYTEVQLTLAHEDDSAALLLNALASTGVPKLKGYRRSQDTPAGQPSDLRFRGPLMGLQESSDESSTLTATFRSPFAVLVGDGSNTGRFVPDEFGLAYTATDAGAIAQALIDEANTDSPTGLTTNPSLIQATKLRDREYPMGQNVGSAVTDLSAVLDGFDFFESFVDGPGSTDAYFNVVATLGETRSDVRFEYGAGTLGNVFQVQRTTTPPQNSIFVMGGNGLSEFYSDPASVAKYGKWWALATFSTIIDQGTLADKARGLCRPYPVKTVSITPDLGLDSCPRPFDDWNLGDTVSFYAARASLQENTQIRINSFTIPIDDSGFESLQVQDGTTPEEDNVTRASLVAEVVLPDGGSIPG